jgi:hypothetical protein
MEQEYDLLITNALNERANNDIDRSDKISRWSFEKLKFLGEIITSNSIEIGKDKIELS